MFAYLSKDLADITGFRTVCLQPNSGGKGEYAELLSIKKYHESRGDRSRNVCLIPTSAHGTNPASAAMLGMKIVGIGCDDLGNVGLNELRQKAEGNKDELSCLTFTARTSEFMTHPMFNCLHTEHELLRHIQRLE